MLKQLKPRTGRAASPIPQFRADVLAGLARRPRAIPARWFYDRRGSELFEAITDLPEYYPTRTEAAVLEAIVPRTGRARSARGARWSSSDRVRRPRPRWCCARSNRPPMCRSISRAISCANRRKPCRAAFPGLLVLPFEADFMHPLDAAADDRGRSQTRVLSRLDDRQSDPAGGGRPAAHDARLAGREARCC